MATRWRCANMDLMSEIRDRRLSEVGELADRLIAAEAEVTRIREQLHAKIRETGDPALDKEDKAGPSAIARASRHRYTREYVGNLIKSPPKAGAQA